MENYLYEEMTKSSIYKLLDMCNICILGTSDCNIPYLIPMFFNYKIEDDSLTINLNSKNSGRKIKNLINNRYVNIFIQYTDNDAYKTISMEGLAYIKNRSNIDKSNMITINVKIEEIDGRVYYK